MEKTQINQTEYDKLIEERSAFQQAGMTAKMVEWDFKIKSLEVAQKYRKIDFPCIAKEFGIDGLNQAIQDRRDEIEKEIEEMCGELLEKKTISEAALYDFISKNSFRWENNPEMTTRILEKLTPKLKGIARSIFQTAFKVKEGTNDKVAFIRIEKVEDYQQNDNPPMQELMKVVDANVANLFHTLYIAFPMVGPVKEIDPIIFGILRDPTKHYNELNPGWNSELTADTLDWLNLGDMYQIAQWE